jgi:hypothetical protein
MDCSPVASILVKPSLNHENTLTTPRCPCHRYAPSGCPVHRSRLRSLRIVRPARRGRGSPRIPPSASGGLPVPGILRHAELYQRQRGKLHPRDGARLPPRVSSGLPSGISPGLPPDLPPRLPSCVSPGLPPGVSSGISIMRSLVWEKLLQWQRLFWSLTSEGEVN